MEPVFSKITFLVFIAVFAMGAKSQTEHSIGTYTTSETERCVCQPHVTINPPVCGRSVPVNSSTGCNSTTVKEILRTVSINQETVSSELGDTRGKMDELSTNQEIVTSELKNTTHQLKDTIRQVEELHVAVSGIQETVSSELGDTIRQVEELQVAVSSNQENVTSEIRGIRRQLEELQVSVSSVVELLHFGHPKDCSEILAGGDWMSGVYTVQPLDSGRAFSVYCDMETDGGGWTVFQRRLDGRVDFYLDFASYSRGFGNLEGEFWLGNDKLHRLTAQGDYELWVDVSDFENESRYATYDSFSIADVSDNYRLTVGSYSGTAGDSLSYHNNYQFSTKDRDNDAWEGSCADLYQSGWWFRHCHTSSLNGEYFHGVTPDARGVGWHSWKGLYYSLKTTDMKIRPTPQ